MIIIHILTSSRNNDSSSIFKSKLAITSMPLYQSNYSLLDSPGPHPPPSRSQTFFAQALRSLIDKRLREEGFYLVKIEGEIEGQFYNNPHKQ